MGEVIRALSIDRGQSVISYMILKIYWSDIKEADILHLILTRVWNNLIVKLQIYYVYNIDEYKEILLSMKCISLYNAMKPVY